MPTEAIERVEVLRGPAAARYGSGAAGGVVNIVTRAIPDQLSGSATAYYERAQDARDGNSQRATFSLAGPISDMLGFRLSGNIAKTDADAWDINRGHASTRTGNFASTFPAGREGLRNRDLAGRLTLKPNAAHRIDLDTAFSRQGNIYAGDTQNTNNFTVGPGGDLAPTAQRVWDALGSETNRMHRTSVSLGHQGKYDFGNSRSYLQYERTRNRRLNEGLNGGSCYLRGNSDLKAETSINKELGIEYASDTLLAGLTGFHNAYRNKVDAGLNPVGSAVGGSGAFVGSDIFQWTNVPRAEVAGLEGSFNLRLNPSLSWSNNLTWILRSRDKSTGEQLSIIPKYTLNARLDWHATSKLDLYASATFYGGQKPNRLDFQSLPMSGEEAQQISPYAIANLSGRYHAGRNLALNFGVKNVFDKRLYRKGNAVGVNNPRTIYGAGAYTYNEPARALYVSLNGRF